ncbi:hypothetical protein M378DRAFT_173982 [Amanita muscaria Koide BX008]|uniref:Uncharacterized protein n=1 Tax=Amanita muscaria (strain Koide BX008) TaxID=946122 RepID=A0A0C2WFH0_AMAMK|nr:hypothetical protein M378DRAFT_173982 [Amanita muscaria Koide BX008]
MKLRQPLKITSLSKETHDHRNRMIVGLPLYRDPDWMDLNKTFTLDTGKASIPLIPSLLFENPGALSV